MQLRSSSNPSKDGALLFARHSFMPNALGYCGPDENQIIFESLAKNTSGNELKNILRDFQGAFPYLRFLAEQIGHDPFDFIVTEAYWIGNGSLEQIPPDAFYKHLHKRLAKKFSSEHLKSFFKARPFASFPHHSLHVFNAFSTMGTVPDSFSSGNGHDKEVGNLMDKCRISWARVIDASQRDIIAEYQPVIRKAARLSLGEPIHTRLVRSINGTDLLPALRAGDWVSAHWGFACARITSRQVENLRRYTLSSMEIANSHPVPQ